MSARQQTLPLQDMRLETDVLRLSHRPNTAPLAGETDAGGLILSFAMQLAQQDVEMELRKRKLVGEWMPASASAAATDKTTQPQKPARRPGSASGTRQQRIPSVAAPAEKDRRTLFTVNELSGVRATKVSQMRPKTAPEASTATGGASSAMVRKEDYARLARLSYVASQQSDLMMQIMDDQDLRAVRKGILNTSSSLIHHSTAAAAAAAAGVGVGKRQGSRSKEKKVVDFDLNTSVVQTPAVARTSMKSALQRFLAQIDAKRTATGKTQTLPGALGLVSASSASRRTSLRHQQRHRGDPPPSSAAVLSPVMACASDWNSSSIVADEDGQALIPSMVWSPDSALKSGGPSSRRQPLDLHKSDLMGYSSTSPASLAAKGTATAKGEFPDAIVAGETKPVTRPTAMAAAEGKSDRPSLLHLHELKRQQFAEITRIIEQLEREEMIIRSKYSDTVAGRPLSQQQHQQQQHQHQQQQQQQPDRPEQLIVSKQEAEMETATAVAIEGHRQEDAVHVFTSNAIDLLESLRFRNEVLERQTYRQSSMLSVAGADRGAPLSGEAGKRELVRLSERILQSRVVGPCLKEMNGLLDALVVGIFKGELRPVVPGSGVHDSSADLQQQLDAAEQSVSSASSLGLSGAEFLEETAASHVDADDYQNDEFDEEEFDEE